ncbi:hypothetical protein F5887DRAFT_965505 [Amanita rubescens]|nr:hypothetical protein F5887DRAFT_965505 [Amanita rubescens]
MMDGVVHLDVDDTSPTISYSPSSSISLTNPGNGWTPCFTLSGCNTLTGAIPNGTSYYITADNNASFTITWQGTGVQLLGNVSTAAYLNYTVYLDGKAATPDLIDLSQQVLASFQDLPLREHNISLVVKPSNSSDGFLAFDKATITAPSPINTTGNYVLQSVNDSDIAWYGRWSFESVPQLGQVYRSTNAGDRVTTYLKGTAIMLSGITTPHSAVYSVSLQPNEYNDTDFSLTPTNYSAETSFTNPHALLFYASSLNPTIPYALTVTNEDGAELMIRPGDFQVFAPNFPVSPPSGPTTTQSDVKTSMSSGTIAAVVLAGVLFIVIVALLIYYYLIYRPRIRRCRAQFNALMARSTKGGSPSHKTRESEHSSYRRRISRILSMLGPSPSGFWNAQRPPPVPPIGRSVRSVDSQYFSSNNIPDDGGEIGVVPIRDPTQTIESVPRLSASKNGIRRVPSIVIDITQKPSPNASVPVSPISASVGGTQSQRQSSQISLRPRSNTFSFPISFSLRHVRVHGTGSSGSSGRQQGLTTSSAGYRDLSVEHADEERGADSVSTMSFAKPSRTGGTVTWKLVGDDTVQGKRSNLQESVGKVARSIFSGLRAASGLWTKKSTGTGVVYPFVGVSSSSVPSGSRRAVSGGGLIVLEGGRTNLDPGLLESQSPSSQDGKGSRSESPHSQAGTAITPLSYENNDSTALTAGGHSSSRHPYAAVVEDVRPPRRATVPTIITSPAAAADDREPEKELTAEPPVPSFRQLPPVPITPHTILAPQPSGSSIARPIRALPPLPIAPVSEAVTETPANVETLPSPSQTGNPSSLELDVTPGAQQHEGPLLSPPSARSGSQRASQRTSKSSKSSKSRSSKGSFGFLTLSSMSPFRLDFLDLGSREGSVSDSASSKSRAKQKERRPVPPKSNVTPGNTGSTRPVSLPPLSETARHPIQRSFLDFSNGSSSSFGRPEPSPIVEPVPELDIQDDRVIEIEDDRATFGQKRDRKSVYYYSSANPPVPSPAESHYSFQTHKTHQTYQSDEHSHRGHWQKGRHASWRTTFGVRQEYIPEEASPSSPDAPFIPPQPAETSIAPQETTDPHPVPPLPREISSDPDQGRLSYVSTSPTVDMHVHPLPTDFGASRHGSSHPVSTSQTSPLEVTSPTTDASPSSIHFRAGGIRRTSSGDVRPGSASFTTKDD